MIFFFNLVCIALLFSSLTNKEIPKFPHYLHHGRPKKCWKISCLAGSVRNVLIAKNFFYKHFKAKSLTIGLKDDDDKGDDRLDDTELQGPLLAEPAAINLASINQSASRTCTNESGINQSINQSVYRTCTNKSYHSNNLLAEPEPMNLLSINQSILQNLQQRILYRYQSICLQNLHLWILYQSINQPTEPATRILYLSINLSACRTLKKSGFNQLINPLAEPAPMNLESINQSINQSRVKWICQPKLLKVKTQNFNKKVKTNNNNNNFFKHW